MLSEIDIHNVLFLDIETVPFVKSFHELSEDMQILWEKKSALFRSGEQGAEDVYDRAGIYAEFGKIICISVGLITRIKNGSGIRIKSYAGDDELKVLSEFAEMVRKYTGNKNLYLCAHNGKEFDFPYLARRMLINGIKLPRVLDNAGKKPWEIRHLDTMELWKFGDYKHYTSLDLLTTVFNIPSPKTDMDGSKVAGVYYRDNDLPRIIRYCQADVIAIIQLLLRYKGIKLIPEENVEYPED